jgi:predicted transcriptional regulator
MADRREIRLGPLETKVLEWLWDRDWGDVKGAHAAIGRKRALSRNTLHSTLERLVRKGLIERERQGRAYRYRARISRAEWVRERLRRSLVEIPGADPALLLAGFVDFAERVDEAGLLDLERLVQTRRREREAEKAKQTSEPAGGGDGS